MCTPVIVLIPSRTNLNNFAEQLIEVSGYWSGIRTFDENVTCRREFVSTSVRVVQRDVYALTNATAVRRYSKQFFVRLTVVRVRYCTYSIHYCERMATGHCRPIRPKPIHRVRCTNTTHSARKRIAYTRTRPCTVRRKCKITILEGSQEEHRESLVRRRRPRIGHRRDA